MSREVPMNAQRGAGSPVSATARLHARLFDEELLFLMEAHDGLSARIAEVEGFEAIWASGFSVSTSLGMRDSDEVTWSQLLAVVECMLDASTLPVVVDGDTGYGNFNSARRFVRRAERIGAAGVCIEDKIFPKTNSFVDAAHELEAIDSFTGKLRACKSEQIDPDFCIIARTEALIAGQGMNEALRRATAYCEAGADAIFVHSRLPVADEIKEFARRWNGSRPLVISPTTYAAKTPTAAFRRSGISTVIWANQSMRAAAAAMRRLCRELRAVETDAATQTELASLAEIFDLMGYRELAEATEKYECPRTLPESSPPKPAAVTPAPPVEARPSLSSVVPPAA
jgi:phosphoenolpyruvate phosphomutase